MSKKEVQAGSVEITLSKPLDIDGAKVSVLTMREPTVGDQLASEAASPNQGVQEITLFANLCMVTPDQIKSLTLRDYKKMQQVYLGFTV